jgi:hypothetical protein
MIWNDAVDRRIWQGGGGASHGGGVAGLASIFHGGCEGADGDGIRGGGEATAGDGGPPRRGCLAAWWVKRRTPPAVAWAVREWARKGDGIHGRRSRQQSMARFSRVLNGLGVFYQKITPTMSPY